MRMRSLRCGGVVGGSALYVAMGGVLGCGDGCEEGILRQCSALGLVTSRRFGACMV
jgi:hypothetical protein